MKKIVIAFLCVFFIITFSGCAEKRIDELYKLPQQSKEYENLQSSIDEIIDSGAKYAAPTSGSNRQSVQLYDIDNDGTEEAIAFFIKEGDEKPLKIYIFNQEEDEYKVESIIEGEGTAIDSINYIDLTGDGLPEIIVGWKIIAEMQTVSVYSMVDLKPVRLMTDSYSQYLLDDMTQDYYSDLIILNSSETDTVGTVSLYTFDTKGNAEMYSANLSVGTTVVSNLTVSNLKDKYPALYIESTYDGETTITDIMCYTEDKLINVTADDMGISTKTLTTYPSSWKSLIGVKDINKDSVMEVPEVIKLSSDTDTSTNFYVIRWYSYSVTGEKSLVVTTYHNFADSWYVELPDEWVDRLAINRVDDISGEREIKFSIKDGEENKEVFSIFTLTGENREDRATIEGRTVLSVENEKIYTAKILGQNQELTTEELVEMFHVIRSTWD